MEKLLTICTAAYNAEKYIGKMIESILGSKYYNALDFIIVNDGSSDNTEKIISGFVNKYPGIITLINKKNGGSGSARNVAFKLAKGKYIKLIDADDYVVTKNFDEYLERLSAIDVDMVINPHFEKNLIIRKTTEVNSYNSFKEGINAIDDIPNAEAFSMHDITYRTSLISKNGFRLSEGKSYVDMEYLTLPIRNVRNYAFINIPFYVYVQGIPGQSIDPQILIRKQDQKKYIAEELTEYVNNTALSIGQYRVVFNSYSRMLKSLLQDYRKVNSFKCRKAMIEADSYILLISDSVYRELNNDLTIRLFRLTNYYAYYPYVLIKIIRDSLFSIIGRMIRKDEV